MNELYYDELRSRLGQYAEEPDDRLWNSITARIEEENRASRLRKKTRNGWIFLLGVVMITGFYTMVDSVSDDTSSSFQSRPEQKSMDQVQQEHEATSKVTLPLSPPVDSNSKTPKASSLKSLIETVESKMPQADVNEASFMHDSNDGQSLPLASLETSLLQITDDTRLAVIKEASSTGNNDVSAASNESGNEGDEGQSDNENNEKKKRPFNIYFTIMPTLGYQRIEPNSNDNLIIESIDRIEAFSTDRLGLRAELGVEYPIADRVNIFGGLVYFQRHQTIGYTEKQVSDPGISEGPDGETLLEPEFSYVQKSFDYEVRNLGLQIGANYQISKKKFLQTVGTGIEFHLALNKLQHSEHTAEFTNNPSVYVFYNLYYRIQYPTDTKLKAVMQPTLNYSFYINQNANAPFYVKPYGLGLNVGFTYNF